MALCRKRTEGGLEGRVTKMVQVISAIVKHNVQGGGTRVAILHVVHGGRVSRGNSKRKVLEGNNRRLLADCIRRK